MRFVGVKWLALLPVAPSVDANEVSQYSLDVANAGRARRIVKN